MKLLLMDGLMSHDSCALMVFFGNFAMSRYDIGKRGEMKAVKVRFDIDYDERVKNK